MIDVLLVVVFLALLVASYTDIRTREVPDWLSYGLLFTAFGIKGIFSFSHGLTYFVESILGFLIFLVLALFLYHSRQWGGADAKLLMGMGAVIGVSLPLSAESLSLFWFFLLLLLLGSIYGFIWMLTIALRQWTDFHHAFQKVLKDHRGVHYTILLVSVMLIITAFFIPLLFIMVFVPPLTLYALLSVGIIEKSFFRKKVNISKVTLGDWLAEDITKDGILIMKRKTLNSKDLQKLYDSKIRQVTIKEGIPFVPSFLLAYIVFLFFSTPFALL
ncbi:hypothetical protein COV20_00385 [Candidatus Woesearchaeota archaeon CG10_big_fil_rev_8_21_14_0_10_45_16]|nr:MAG: hypothetical protein COV20_00385 [Candidatus Woesearchaeota archaeon CG10_big_fil_rev_8_21_14_0_10_45_16]